MMKNKIPVALVFCLVAVSVSLAQPLVEQGESNGWPSYTVESLHVDGRGWQGPEELICTYPIQKCKLKGTVSTVKCTFLITKEQGAKDKGAKDKGAKDKGAKDKGAKDKGAKDKGAKDKGAKDKGAKDKGAKDKGAKDEEPAKACPEPTLKSITLNRTGEKQMSYSGLKLKNPTVAIPESAQGTIKRIHSRHEHSGITELFYIEFPSDELSMESSSWEAAWVRKRRRGQSKAAWRLSSTLIVIPKTRQYCIPRFSRSEVIEDNSSSSPPPYEASANEGDLLSLPRIDKITKRVYYKNGKTDIIEIRDELPGRSCRVVLRENTFGLFEFESATSFIPVDQDHIKVTIKTYFNMRGQVKVWIPGILLRGDQARVLQVLDKLCHVAYPSSNDGEALYSQS
eukprot:Nk52_evm1s1443 gene=Nk52_evmTU1s1443